MNETLLHNPKQNCLIPNITFETWNVEQFQTVPVSAEVIDLRWNSQVN